MATIDFWLGTRRGIARLAACLLLLLMAGTPVCADSPQWTSCGPYGGKFLALAVSPDDADGLLLFAGAESGGLFSSQDGGDSWRRLNGLPADLTISAIVLSPAFAQDETLYVASLGGGVSLSEDGGQSWIPRQAGLPSLYVTGLALSPYFPMDHILLAATDVGLYRSEDAGVSWIAVGPDGNCLAVTTAQDAGDQFVAYAGTVSGLYMSTDGGQTWEPTALTGFPVTAVALSPDYAQDHGVLAGTFGGAYLSWDGGETWLGPWVDDQVIYAVTFSPASTEALASMEALASTEAPDLFLACDAGVYRSQDGGETWGVAGQLDERANALLVVDRETASTLFAATDTAGIYRSADRGTTWEVCNRGLENLALQAVVLSPAYAQDGVLFAGGQSGVWKSADDGLHWALVGLRGVQVNALLCSVGYAVDRTVYAATNGGFFFSTDGGESWRSASQGLRALEISAVTQDAAGGNLWIATKDDGVYYAPTGDLVWSRRSEGLPATPLGAIYQLTTDEGGACLLVGTRGRGFYRSEDGGLSWTPVTTGPQEASVRTLAGVMGYGGRPVAFGATQAGLWRSIDCGVSWYLAGFADADVRAVALRPDYARRPELAVGVAGDGVYASTNGGLTWRSLNEGLGNLQVQGLAMGVQGDEAVLFAATGSGVWRYGVSTEPLRPALFLPLVLR